MKLTRTEVQDVIDQCHKAMTMDVTGQRDRTDDVCSLDLRIHVSPPSRILVSVTVDALRVMLYIPVDKLKVSKEVFPHLRHLMFINERLTKAGRRTTEIVDKEEHEHFQAWPAHTTQECLPLLNARPFNREQPRDGWWTLQRCAIRALSDKSVGNSSVTHALFKPHSSFNTERKPRSVGRPPGKGNKDAHVEAPVSRIAGRSDIEGRWTTAGA